MNILQKLNLSNPNPIRPQPPSSQFLDHIFEEEEDEGQESRKKDGEEGKDEGKKGGKKETGVEKRMELSVIGGRGKKEETELRGNLNFEEGEGKRWDEGKGKRIKMCEHKGGEEGSKMKEFIVESERKKKRFSGGFNENKDMNEGRSFLDKKENATSKREVSPKTLPNSKIWNTLLNVFGLDSLEFSKKLRQEKFDSLPKPFNEFNIWRIFNDERYVNGKIERLVVFMKDFEIFYDVVKAELMDFSGEIIGSFPRELFNEECKAIEKDIYNEENDDFSIVSFIKGNKIMLKKSMIFCLMNVTVFSPVENLYYLNICENNIEFFIS